MQAASECMCMYVLRVGWDGGESVTERMMSMIMEDEDGERMKERQREVEAIRRYQSDPVILREKEREEGHRFELLG